MREATWGEGVDDSVASAVVFSDNLQHSREAFLINQVIWANFPDIVKNKRAQTAVSLTAIRDAVGPKFVADIPYGISGRELGYDPNNNTGAFFWK